MVLPVVTAPLAVVTLPIVLVATPILDQVFSVELYWSGEVYRGFFTDFNVTEAANDIGFFNYDITFLATQKRGMRQNFFAWHRAATTGPSGHAAYSFGNLIAGDNLVPQVGRSPSQSDTALSNLGKSLGF